MSAHSSVAGPDQVGFEVVPALDLLLEATRSLLWIKTRAEAARVVATFVKSLGATVGPAAAAGACDLPVDISFGEGEPAVPSAPAGSIARMHLERYLPMLVEDSRRAIELSAQTGRLAAQATIDSLTCLPNRQMVGRALGRVQPGDAIVMVDLDHFKRVNDTLGHGGGDDVLRAFGKTLRATVRGRDIVGRYGGEEFVIILTAGAGPDEFLNRLTRAWTQERPEFSAIPPVTFSAGVAWVGDSGADALKAADRALYRAKDSGRDRWAWAAAVDYADPERAPAAAPRTPDLPATTGGDRPRTSDFLRHRVV